MQSKQRELKVVRGTRSFSAAPPLHSAPCRRQRERCKGRRRGAEGAEVELDQLVDGLGQKLHALRHRTAVTCQGSGQDHKGEHLHGNEHDEQEGVRQHSPLED